MKQTTKKIGSLLFILLGFAPLLFTLVITIKKKEIRHRMEYQLGARELQTILIPEHEVIWMDDHEIWVNNSMFDIQVKKLENGVYTFTGLYDEEETKLVQKEREASGMSHEQNKLRAQLLKLLPVFFVEPTDEIPALLQVTQYNFFIPVPPVNPFREITTPPPRPLIFC